MAVQRPRKGLGIEYAIMIYDQPSVRNISLAVGGHPVFCLLYPSDIYLYSRYHLKIR